MTAFIITAIAISFFLIGFLSGMSYCRRIVKDVDREMKEHKETERTFI